jgi:hypothetical protein
VRPAYAAAGAALFVTPLVQLDAFVERGLNDSASDVLFGSWRWPD